MTENKETNKLKVNKLKNEVPTNQQQQEVDKKQLIILTGITTSRIEQALKSDNPYPARVFLKVEGQEQDIPVFFRIKENNNWIRPKIKTGSVLQVEGYFSVGTVYTKQSERKSFTATSYQLLDPNLQGKFTLAQATQELPEFEQAYQQIKQVRQILESHE